MRPSRILQTTSLAVALGLAACAGRSAPSSSTYDDLVTLFQEWRAFQQPKLVDGVPDYSAGAMRAQRRELANYRRRLAAIDPGAWPVAQQVDYQLVRAEMNGLDFDHRVHRPWARNPAFYVTVFPSQSDQPAREGPHAYGSIELWTYDFPITSERAAELGAQLKTIPPLLEQAKASLVENTRDLWIMGIREVSDQSAALAALAARVEDSSPEVAAEARRAREATDGFRVWLEAQAESKTGPSGVGIENYNWHLSNVQLVPITWEEQVTIMRRELARARSALVLEEHRNRRLPQPVPVASAAEHTRRFNAAVTEYMAFLRDREMLTVRDYMDPALRARIGTFSDRQPREFFTEVDYRDPVVMRTHGYHWFDLARAANEPHPSPIRRATLLYNIFDSRTEGLATGWEEMMMHAGLLEARPRSRELIWVLLAQRAARALGDLMMHANQWTLEEAVTFAVSQTPRGWLREDGNTVWGEQHLYLQQPAYGTSYVIGKIQIEQLLAERARQVGDGFTLKGFMDELNAVGMIPMSLIRWELTGQRDGIRMMAVP
jgi:uncharacterized protein (DUF885 family)